ncbi:MAG: substrate-binding domain-containing protein [Pseudomonadota bacterium]|nr:substrate-binding domain-containing protein [Pseudomonadota bacterium]
MRQPLIAGVAALLLVTGCAIDPPAPAAEARSSTAKGAVYEVVPQDKDDDLRIFHGDGRVTKGIAALQGMDGAQLVVWLAGNQFFAMTDVINAFQRRNPSIGSVALITLPPGLLLRAIQKGGWTYQGRSVALQPDIYGSVDIGHLKQLRARGSMDQYMVYLHNEMELIVAKGNPKQIKGIDDLGRNDVRSMLPNPVDEGIMTFYAKPVLQRHGLWARLSGGKECKACQPSPNAYFTAVHHREIPAAIKAGTTDVGIVWVTETRNELQAGSEVLSIRLPPEDSMVREVGYVVGTLRGARNAAAALRYLEFLKTDEAQSAYSRYGFVRASPSELSLRPIP